MPNFNHGHYIEASLRSHLAQSVRPSEVIVVDDGSTDDSRDVVNAIAADDKIVRLICHSHNKGPLAAVNRGLGEASGDCVCLAAADDLVHREFARRSLEALSAFPAAAFCFSDPTELIGDSGAIRHYPLHLSPTPAYFAPHQIERIMRRNFFTISANTAVFRRSYLDRFGGIREDLDWLVEWITLNGLALRHGACYVPATLAYLRVDRHSYSAQRVRRAREQRELALRALDLLHCPEFADLAPRFRSAALLPEMRLRTLFWLMGSPRNRSYLTPRLILRVLARQAWAGARPLTPAPVRRAMRQLAGRATRAGTIEGGP